MRHWTSEEIQRLMIERGLDIHGLAVLSNVSAEQIRRFLAGKCLLTTVNIEKLLKAMGHELEIVSDGTPNPARECQWCGRFVIPVEVHGHKQCPVCQAILERCCED